MPREIEPLRLGTHRGGVHLVAEGGDEVARLRGGGAEIALSAKGAAHLARWLREWAKPRERLQLWGAGDISRELRVSDATVTKWRRLDGFPAPAARPSCGPVWRPADVRAWHRHDRRGPGRPRKGAQS